MSPSIRWTKAWMASNSASPSWACAISCAASQASFIGQGALAAAYSAAFSATIIVGAFVLLLGMTADDICFSASKAFHAYGLGNNVTFPYSVVALAVAYERLAGSAHRPQGVGKAAPGQAGADPLDP